MVKIMPVQVLVFCILSLLRTVRRKKVLSKLYFGENKNTLRPEGSQEGRSCQKRELFTGGKPLHQGRSPAFFKTILAESICPLGFSFLNKDPLSRSPVKRPCHHCLVKIPSAKSKRLLSEDFPAPESLKLLNVIRWGHTASAARPTSSNAVQLQGQPAAKPSAPSSVILKALSACLKISRKPSARSQARVPRLTASS